MEFVHVGNKMIRTDDPILPAKRTFSKYAVGSNQYKLRSKTKSNNGKLLIGFYVLFFTAIGGVLAYKFFSPEFTQAKQLIEESQFEIVSPLPEIDEKPLTLEQEQNWEAMKRMARKLSPLFDYPAEVMIAQMALESARGTSKYCVERNNCFGMNAVDHDPDQAFWYDSKEEAMIDYMMRIKKHYKKAYAVRSNPVQMVIEIKNGGYATDPNYVEKVTWIMQREGK